MIRQLPLSSTYLAFRAIIWWVLPLNVLLTFTLACASYYFVERLFLDFRTVGEFRENLTKRSFLYKPQNLSIIGAPEAYRNMTASSNLVE
jgi:hypothetical protein